MISNEYLRFMQTLTADNVTAGVRKVANLVLDKLVEILPLGTNQGQRVKKLVQIAQDNWQTVATDITAVSAAAIANVTPIDRLTSLNVGPFKGFTRAEHFDLDSNLVLIYGPNGTGKSSFCEALEYGLLGTVAEAESKRFRQQEEYLRNVHVNDFASPVIEAVTGDSGSVPLAADEAQFRFCFVEKNRIDNFSRLAAQLPARQTELIATLFGLDSFNEFVHDFSSEIEPRYIDMTGKKHKLLEEKQQALVGRQQVITTNNELLTVLAEQEVALGTQYQDGHTFADLIVSLGTPEAPGEIANLENELQQVVPVLTGLTLQALISAGQAVVSAHDLLTVKQGELMQFSEDLSFKQLYSAVTALNNVSPENCPACKTPLDQVTINPFVLATQELEKLAHLSELEKARDQLSIKLADVIKAVYKFLKVATERPDNEQQRNPLADYLVGHESSSLNWDWWQSLHAAQDGSPTAWEQLQTQVQMLENRDAVTTEVNRQRAPKQARLTRLREYAKQVLVLQTRRNSIEASIQTATAAITNFNETNAVLITEVAAETPIVATNNEIATSYAEFVSLLSAYNDKLPGQVVADLGDTVVQLYNAFNRYDTPAELLSNIRLPLTSGQRIEVSFQNDPEHYFDVLQVLSEGHIRCIGLAILFAKNLKENCPIMIFDDPVNAIDDDHREAIRRTLFEDNYFQRKQIILACHGEEFFKDVQNLLGAQRTSDSKRFTFLPRLQDRNIRVDPHSAPRNYVLAAQSHLENLEIREALTKSRQALEALAKDKVWRYVSRHGDGNLSILLRSANTPIELRNLMDQLKSKLSKADFVHEQKDAVLTPVTALLGLNGDSREWRYLNKGTHEEGDRSEFDRATVSSIVAALTQIDAALSTDH